MYMCTCTCRTVIDFENMGWDGCGAIKYDIIHNIVAVQYQVLSELCITCV